MVTINSYDVPAPMIIPAGKSFTLEIQQTRGVGSPWVVRLYRKNFLLKKRISSDWFLDEEQAMEFARELANSMKDDQAPETLKNRPPGWVLHPPPH